MTSRKPGSAPRVARSIRSYVIRAGRMTAAQSRALAELAPQYGTNLAELAQPAALFARRAPLYLEIGFGNGDNLVSLARATPARDFLGCEVHRPGLGHALHRAAAAGLHNLRLLGDDANDVLRALPPASLSGAMMFFPDPWPKKRHHKRRLLDAALLARLAVTLRVGGCLWFASDHQHYAEQVLGCINDAPGWVNLAAERGWAPRPRTRIVTRFEARARRDGRAVYEVLAGRVYDPR